MIQRLLRSLWYLCILACFTKKRYKYSRVKSQWRKKVSLPTENTSCINLSWNQCIGWVQQQRQKRPLINPMSQSTISRCIPASSVNTQGIWSMTKTINTQMFPVWKPDIGPVYSSGEYIRGINWMLRLPNRKGLNRWSGIPAYTSLDLGKWLINRQWIIQLM